MRDGNFRYELPAEKAHVARQAHQIDSYPVKQQFCDFPNRIPCGHVLPRRSEVRGRQAEIAGPRESAGRLSAIRKDESDLCTSAVRPGSRALWLRSWTLDPTAEWAIRAGGGEHSQINNLGLLLIDLSSQNHAANVVKRFAQTFENLRTA